MVRPLIVLAVISPTILAAQTQPEVLRDRAEHVRWVETADDSPFAAIARQPLGRGLTLGPTNADIPLEGVPLHRLEERGSAVRLEHENGARIVPRGRTTVLGHFRMHVTGRPGRTIATVFDPRARRNAKPPAYYAYDSTLVFLTRLAPAARAATVLLLGADGIEVEATEAGTVTLPLGSRASTLRVRRLPIPGTEESELEIFFRDSTNTHDTYPAGRFVALIPTADGRYRVDFNRARNPFCAYNATYPCPAPWSGNAVAAPVRAGERYAGGGLTPPVEVNE